MTAGPAKTMPAFPLGTALLPGMALPLRIFEPRYRAMMRTVMDADTPEFVVALIERGSEVGGGDARSDVGCIARVLEADELPDGQWMLLAVGIRRVRVTDWAPDDPYPIAEIEIWDDPRPGDDPTDRLDLLELRVLQLASLGREFGLSPLDPDDRFSDEQGLRCYQLATVAPLGSHDRMRLLRCRDLGSRLDLLEELVEEQELLFRARRTFGDEGTDT